MMQGHLPEPMPGGSQPSAMSTARDAMTELPSRAPALTCPYPDIGTSF